MPNDNIAKEWIANIEMIELCSSGNDTQYETIAIVVQQLEQQQHSHSHLILNVIIINFYNSINVIFSRTIF